MWNQFDFLVAYGGLVLYLTIPPENATMIQLMRMLRLVQVSVVACPH